MDITLTLTAREEDGLNKITAAFNAHQGPKDTLTPEEYAAKELGVLLNGWADQFDVAVVGGKTLEDAIIADPVAAKQAILDKRAREASAVAVVADVAEPIIEEKK